MLFSGAIPCYDRASNQVTDITNPWGVGMSGTWKSVSSFAFALLFSQPSAAFAELCVEPTDGPASRILAFGDFGTADAAQYRTARAMQKFCSENGCQTGVTLGDNFYPAGVKSVDDNQFKVSFEDPYGPLKIPFYVSLGNHDYGNGGQRGNIQAQIDYTALSKWWKLPARYYKFQASDAEFFALDTNTLITGDKAQDEWFQKSFADSSATWKIVYGHHPIYSGGLHGDTDELIANLLPELCKSPGNTLYLAGHDHDRQVLKTSCGVPLVVSGAAAYSRPTKKTANTVFSSADTGFAYLVVQPEKVTVCLVDTQGKINFRYVKNKTL